jgi:hypothetical protein
LRDQLVGELKAIASSGDTAVRAQRILGAKNSLTEADARQLEDAFQAKLATLEDVNGQPLSPAHADHLRNRILALAFQTLIDYRKAVVAPVEPEKDKPERFDQMRDRIRAVTARQSQKCRPNRRECRDAPSRKSGVRS